MSLSIGSLNAKGLRNSMNIKHCFCLLNKCAQIFSFFKNLIPVIFKNQITGDMLLSKCDPEGHDVCNIIVCFHITVLIINFYGYNAKSVNDQLWLSLDDIIRGYLLKFPHAVIIIVRDFNLVLNNHLDRWPPGHSS